jgi:hypothetical protein
MSVLAALVVAAAAAQAGGNTVTLPLEEYETLRRLRERPSATVVDLLRVEGSFAKRDLAVTLEGRGAGTLPTAEVLTGEGFRLYACQGEALVARAESGAFAVTPLAPRFRARCRIALDGSDRLEASTTRAVLEVESAVADGELVANDGGDGGRDFSVVRRIAGGREDLAPSAAGRYRLTLLPEETRFFYRLEVRNPNRSHRRFELALREGEHVETVDAPVAWDVENGRYRFDLPPGETTLSLSGRLTGTSFTPPVDATLQYLLVESHPLIRPEVKTGAKRVGVGEVGLDATYRGAQAFLLDGATEVTWTAVRLEALKTAGFAVDRLNQIFFLGADRKALGQLDLDLDNQGAPALALPLDGDPTFASVAGEPSFLTRDAEGRLFLPLSQGTQQVSIQDARTFAARLGFAVARLQLPRLGVPASTAAVELRYPAEWIPVYEELAPAARLHLLDRGDVILLLALAVAAERLLALLALGRRRRLLLAGAVVLAAAFSRAVLGWALALAGTGLLVALGFALLRRLSGVRLGIALAAAALGALVAASSVAILLEGVPDLGSPAVQNVAKLAYMESELRAPPASLPPAERARDDVAAAGGIARGYQGLPARIRLPAGMRASTFSRDMLPADGPRHATVVLVAARLVGALSIATLLGALAIAFAFRRDLAAGARALAERLRPAGASAAT